MSEITHDVFISYARRDGLTYAERLDSELARAGLKVWRDRRNLDPAQDFTSELEKAIEHTGHVAVCLTPDTKRDESFVRREIQYAMMLKKPIVPLLFADMAPPISIVTLTHINFAKQAWEHAFGELLHRVQHAPVSYQPPTPSDDPFRDYLAALYQQIVNYLDKTVFSLITLNTEATPDAVDRPEEVAINALPMAFFDMLPDNEPADDTPYADFHTAFEKYDGRVLLLGEPGSGKTTTLMAYARDAVAKRLDDAAQPLPLVAPIATWDAVKAPSLGDWLGEQIRALNAADVALTITTGNALLLLDGLDELGTERQDEQTGERFDPRQRFIDRIPLNNRVLITCRIKDYADIGRKIALNGAVTLQPLNDDQMRAYLARQPDLLAALETDSGLREMARTPLILSLFTFAYSGLGDEAAKLRDLTDSPGDLRDKIFETYVRRRHEHERRKLHSNLPFTLEQVYDVLGSIAMENATNPYAKKYDTVNVFTLEDFETVLGGEIAQAFANFMHQLHLLVPSGEHRLRFIHLLVRDYFAFSYALAKINDINENVRAYVVAALWRIGDTRGVEPLIAVLSDTHWWVRGRAAQALGDIGDGRAVRPLIGLLADTDKHAWDRRVCDFAAEALERIGTPEALAAVAAWRKRQTGADNS
jgi:hypothetical protein